MLSPLGLRFEGVWTNWSYRWDEVAHFRVNWVYANTKLIYFDMRHAHGSVLDGVARGATSRYRTISGLWEVKPEKLVELLNEARSRWGGGSAPTIENSP